MAFRDDKEALHAQVHALRRELEQEQAARSRDAEEAQARLEQERNKHREHDGDSLEGRLKRLAWTFAVGTIFGVVGVIIFSSLTSISIESLLGGGGDRASEPAPAGAEVKPDAEVKPKDLIEEVLLAAKEGHHSDFERVWILTAAGTACASVGRRQQALGLFKQAEAALAGPDWDPQQRVQGLSLVACGLGQAGADARVKKLVPQIKDRVNKLYSDEEELETYDNVTRLCVNNGVGRAAVRPFMELFIAISGKQRGRRLVEIAERMATLRDAEGLTALVGQVLSKPLKTYDADLLAQLAEQLWRAGNQKRASQLLDAMKPGDDASGFDLGQIARALAVAGRKQQARPYAQRALVALRKERGYMATELRKLIAVAFARLGDQATARQVSGHVESMDEVLVAADLLDESLKVERKSPGVYTAYNLALKLARAGRAEEAYEIARTVPNSTWSPQVLAAAFTIVNNKAR